LRLMRGPKSSNKEKSISALLLRENEIAGDIRGEKSAVVSREENSGLAGNNGEMRRKKKTSSA